MPFQGKIRQWDVMNADFFLPLIPSLLSSLVKFAQSRECGMDVLSFPQILFYFTETTGKWGKQLRSKLKGDVDFSTFPEILPIF